MASRFFGQQPSRGGAITPCPPVDMPLDTERFCSRTREGRNLKGNLLIHATWNTVIRMEMVVAALWNVMVEVELSRHCLTE